MAPVSSPRRFSRASGQATVRALTIGMAVALVGVVAVVTLSSADGSVTGAGASAPSARIRPSLRAKAERSKVAAPTRPVSFFGDSLSFEAKGAYAAQLARRNRTAATTSTYPTTALCDFRPVITADLLQHRPGVLVLEFSGNSYTECMRDRTGTLLAIGSARWITHYLDDLSAVLAVARTTGTTVVWATAPPVSPAKFATNYPRTLAAAIRQLALANDGLRVADTGAALTTDGHTFTRSLPCRPDESGYCGNGRLVARNDDGLHFDCHGTADRFGSCVGYSAGARRFGEAIADAAADAG